MSIEELRKEHSSYPRNRNIANVFFKAGYIEAWGRGTNKLINSCIEAGLPEPDIKEEQGGISITFFKVIFTEEYIKNLKLDERFIKALLYIKEHESISNAQYQDLAEVSKRTATRDLQDLVEQGLITKSGTTGKGTIYSLNSSYNKGVIKGPKGS